MEYTVILHPAEEGETVEETLSNMKEAMESHLIALKAEGRQAPKDQTMVFSHVEI